MATISLTSSGLNLGGTNSTSGPIGSTYTNYASSCGYTYYGPYFTGTWTVFCMRWNTLNSCVFFQSTSSYQGTSARTSGATGDHYLCIAIRIA